LSGVTGSQYLVRVGVVVAMKVEHINVGHNHLLIALPPGGSHVQLLRPRRGRTRTLSGHPSRRTRQTRWRHIFVGAERADAEREQRAGRWSGKEKPMLTDTGGRKLVATALSAATAARHKQRRLRRSSAVQGWADTSQLWWCRPRECEIRGSCHQIGGSRRLMGGAASSA